MAQRRDVSDNYCSAEKLYDVGTRLAATTEQKIVLEEETKRAIARHGTELGLKQHTHADIP